MNSKDYLLDEYKLAHEELMVIWELYWRQASYFLTFNGLLIAFVSTGLGLYGNYPFLLSVSIFGLVITILWLFHGHRFFYYNKVIEGRMKEYEVDRRFVLRLKRFQGEQYLKRDGVHFLEKMSGAKIRNLVIPSITLTMWIVILTYTIIQIVLV